ncbi:MAG TPA: FAD-dependent oxidoreductase [Candidatus Limnocylindria bacterium]|nr:FAD-dependent oxidoreductase [Candidatus Limnocylindria bacterium]
MKLTSRVAVVGSGVMGAWTALWLARHGHEVLLLDAYGFGNSLASSGGETRVTRSAHGADRHYPRWQRLALDEWRRLEAATGAELFLPTGVLWFAHREDGFEADALRALSELQIPAERLAADEVARRFPGIAAEGMAWALWEPQGGGLMARRGVTTVVGEAQRLGAELRIARVLPPAPADGSGDRLLRLRSRSGETLEADAFVLAPGPWLPSLVPQLELAVTRQEVLFFAPPPGDPRFVADEMPTWIDYDRAFYGLGSVESRGFKCAPDAPGPIVDPDAQTRIVSEAAVGVSRAFLAERFPALAAQPVIEGRVCQYESTPDSHFIIDRHPAWANVWVVGGGSGHGYKHGPVIGEYLAAQIVGDAAVVARLAPPDDRFALRPREAAPESGLRTSAQPPPGRHI